MNSIDVPAQIEYLRAIGGDTWNIEAKSADGGFPGSLDETLSAFANMPEGGLILLGVSENEGGIDVTGVADPKALMEQLGSKARHRLHPPLQLGAVEVHEVEHRNVVACIVPPQDPSLRPFRVGKNGPAFIRSADGDYELSEPEVRVILAQMEPPRFDRKPVAGADVDSDLDPRLLEEYLSQQRSRAPRLRGMDRHELLVRTNVIDPESGNPTMAALYALGIHPQQFFPTLSVKARALPGPDETPGVRLRNQREFAGPIPDLLESTVEWIVENIGSTVVFDATTGHGRNVPELPLVALREVVANALVHRDLSPASLTKYVNVVRRPGNVLVTNPGGLWGLTERQLGTTPPSARNPVLYEMCRSITTADGNRVVEASATGIPAIRRALQEAHLSAPRFRDRVISFDAELSSTSLLSADELEWLRSIPQLPHLTIGQRVAIVALHNGREITNGGFRAEFPTMDSVEARRQLQELVRFGLAKTRGERGSTVYVRPDAPDPAPSGMPRYPGGPSAQRTRISSEAKRELIVSALAKSPSPRSRAEIRDLTGLSEGQLNPMITQLQREGVLEPTEPLQSPNQRYRLAGKSAANG